MAPPKGTKRKSTAAPKKQQTAAKKQQKTKAKGKDEKQKPEEKSKAADVAESKPAEAAEVEKQLLEEGRLFFFYRPKVGVDTVKSLDDVQRFEMIIKPTSRDAKARLIIVGKKRLPDPKKHERFYAFVDAVADDVKELTSELGEHKYETKTMGERVQGAARAAGEAVYTITKHFSTKKASGSNYHTHLAYVLEVPLEPGEAQQVLGIGKAASFSISVKNPERAPPPGAPTIRQKPAYSEEQQKLFNDYAWIQVEDISLLDVVGTQLLLVAAHDDPVAELGPSGEHLSEIYKEDVEELKGAGPEMLAEKLAQDVLQEEKDAEIPIEPAITGQLV